MAVDPPTMNSGSDRIQTGQPGPQDIRVDRRAFLRRIGVLAAAATAGAVPPVPVLGRARVRGLSLQSVDDFFRTAPETPDRVEGLQEVAELTASEAAAMIRTGDLLPSRFLDALLERIDRWDRTYLAFNAVPAESARAAALVLDHSSSRGLLHGIPVAIKDNFHTRGVLTTANSRIFSDFVPESDATCVARIHGAGGLMLGKTQMGPLATTRALTPDGLITTVNAWAPGDPSVSPGGSSSGSATAVAARMAPVAIGTQTGGSITTPALAQGLTGLKPTLGRVPLTGVIPLTYTRDHPGPLARDARDAALILQVLAGPDPGDPRSLGLPPVPDYLAAVSPAGGAARPALRWPTRVGVPPGWETADDPALRRDRSEFLRALERLGAELVEIADPAGWAELSSPLMNAVRLPERSELYLEVLRQDVRLFGVTLSSWINGLLLSGDEYLKGQRARSALLRLALNEVLSRCDVVIQPGSLPFDMIGLPLVAFPIGMRERAGVALPHGVLLGGAPFGEERLLAVAAAWQRVSDWHLRRPPAGDSVEARTPARGTGGRGRLGVEEVAERSQ